MFAYIKLSVEMGLVPRLLKTIQLPIRTKKTNKKVLDKKNRSDFIKFL
jgi:hypothetical protein